MPNLNGFRVAVFAMDGVEESELTSPIKALRDEGANIDIISLKAGKIQAFQHHDKTIQIDVTLDLSNAEPEKYDALLLPGGALNADTARIETQVKHFVKTFHDAAKPIAAICHAPWLLVSAGLVRDRTLTSYKAIQDDIQNAGGTWIDQEVVVDSNWVTSRQPSDLPAFNREMIRIFKDSKNQKSLNAEGPDTTKIKPPSEKKKPESNNREEIHKLSQMIEGIEFAMLTTHDAEGSLHSRPMASQKFESDGTLWFLTRNPTAKTRQIQNNQKVHVAYADPSDQKYISVSGTAQVIQDRTKIQELWNPMYKAWFPKGMDDPSIAAICIQIEQAEYWDSPSSTMAHLYGVIKATLTGKPAHPGDHAKIDIAS